MKEKEKTQTLEELADPLFQRLEDGDAAALRGGWMTFDIGASTPGRARSDTIDDVDRI